MIHKTYPNKSSYKNPSTSIYWVSLSSPRPVIGIEGILYINREKKTISIWDELNGKYIDFFKEINSAVLTTNNSTIIDSNDESNNSIYSFNLVNDNLIITNSEGTIIEIPIPNENIINDKIKKLEERLERLEKLLD